MTSILTFVETFQQIFLLSSSGSSTFLNILILLCLGLVIYALVNASKGSIKVVHAHWHNMFETRPFGTHEFYEGLKKDIVEKGIESVSFSTVKHSEGGLLSANREYLRIKFREYMMDICAAPFAKEAFFVSWWLGDAGVTFRDALTNIPAIGRLFMRREKTFYEQDTEIMFKETMARCVKDTIEQLTALKGMRLDISNWKGSDIKIKTA